MRIFLPLCTDSLNIHLTFLVLCKMSINTSKIMLNWVCWIIARTNLAFVYKMRKRLFNRVGTGMNSLIWAMDEQLKLSLHLPALWVPSTIYCLHSWLRTAWPAWRLLRTSSFPLIPFKKWGWSTVGWDMDCCSKDFLLVRNSCRITSDEMDEL